jgi:hypothetical protein
MKPFGTDWRGGGGRRGSHASEEVIGFDPSSGGFVGIPDGRWPVTIWWGHSRWPTHRVTGLGKEPEVTTERIKTPPILVVAGEGVGCYTLLGSKEMQDER